MKEQQYDTGVLFFSDNENMRYTSKEEEKRKNLRFYET